MGERAEAEIDERCAVLLEELRSRCPELLPAEPLPPGEISQPVDLDSQQLNDLYWRAFRRRAGLRSGTAPAVIWVDGGDEVVVHLQLVRTAVADGILLVGVTLESDQSGPTEVTVPFALGTSKRLAGMLAVTESMPRGDPKVVERWGEALVAAAWFALLDLCEAITAQVGRDIDGSPLIPGAVAAESGRLRVVPQARHFFDRPEPPVIRLDGSAAEDS